MSTSIAAPTMLAIDEPCPPCPDWCVVGNHGLDPIPDREHYGPHHVVAASLEHETFDAYGHQWAHGGEPVVTLTRGEGPDLMKLTLNEAHALAAALLAAVHDIEASA